MKEDKKMDEATATVLIQSTATIEPSLLNGIEEKAKRDSERIQRTLHEGFSVSVPVPEQNVSTGKVNRIRVEFDSDEVKKWLKEKGINIEAVEQRLNELNKEEYGHAMRRLVSAFRKLAKASLSE
jgi:hypothetical protein